MPRLVKRVASWGLRVRSSASVCGCRWFVGILIILDVLIGEELEALGLGLLLYFGFGGCRFIGGEVRCCRLQ